MKLIPFLVVLTCAADGAPESETTLTVVTAHRATMEMIRSVDVEMRIEGVGLQPPTPPSVSIWRWSMSGDEERIRYRYPTRDSNGTADQADMIGDSYQNATENRFLLNWDPENPPILQPRDQGRVKAFIQPASRVAPFSMPPPSVHLLLEFQSVLPGDQRRSLSELVSHSPDVTVQPPTSADAFWKLSVAMPETGSAAEADGRYVIHLDPAAGFLARRITEHYDSYPWHEPGTVKPAMVRVQWIREVEEFSLIAPDIFFPKRVRTRLVRLDTGITTLSIVAEVTQLRVNEPLLADTFDFRFPENVIVRHLPPANGKVRAQLWGPDDSPIMEIHSVADLPEVANDLELGSTWIVLSMLLVGPILVYTATHLWRRSHK